MDPAFLIMGIIQKFNVQCPRCKGRITASKNYSADIIEIPAIGSPSPHLQHEGFEVTLVCGTCRSETRVNEPGFEACIQR